jgi:hypothetical protein
VSVKKKQLGRLGATLLVIWALPGVGLSTLALIWLARKPKPKSDAAPVNERGQYG